MHFGAIIHFAKPFLLTWATVGVLTALYGLLWTCIKSAEMFSEEPKAGCQTEAPAPQAEA